MYEFSNSTITLENNSSYFGNNPSRGTAIYIKDSLMSEQIILPTCLDEYTAAMVDLGNGETLLILNIYRSPNSSEVNNGKISNLLIEAKNLQPTHILIVGDFNYKEINWNTQNSTAGVNHPATKFLETIRDHFLYQHVLEPTRYSDNNQRSTLDLILTNEEGMVENLE